MAIGLDFSQSNKAISRFNQFLQADLLDQLSSDRDTMRLQVQDKLMRERAVEQGQIDMGVAGYKSALTDKEAYTKAMLDIAKMPEYDYLVSMARFATDPSLPEDKRAIAMNAAKEYGAISRALALSYYNASRGQGNPMDAYEALRGGGMKGLTDWMQTNGMGVREGMQQSRAERTEKAGIEADTTKAWQGQIKESRDYLVSQGVQGQAVTGEMKIFVDSKTLDPMNSEDRGYTLYHLNRIWQKITDEGPGSMTPGEKDFIAMAWNTYAANKAAGTMGGGIVQKPVTPPAIAGAAGASGALPPTAPGAAPGRPSIDAKTGLSFEQEKAMYSEIRRGLINSKVQEGLNMTYGEGYSPTPAELREMEKAVKKYIDNRLGPTMWSGWNTIAEPTR
jgi:hypothetical protein